MKRIIQLLLLKTYALIEKTGILEFAWSRRLFLTAYEWYKLLLEAKEIEALRNYVKPGEVVIDIGANVGFFTKRFVRWVNEGGFVIAVEPEAINFRLLVKNIQKCGGTSVVKFVQGVAAEKQGILKLAINPKHPGDHKIGTEGEEVNAFTIDGLVEKEQATRVCLIKIDVQGAEERVLRGALDTIKRDHPALLVEMDDNALRHMGSRAESVLNLLTGLGYSIHRLSAESTMASISKDEVLNMCCGGCYADLLFVHK